MNALAPTYAAIFFSFSFDEEINFTAVVEQDRRVTERASAQPALAKLARFGLVEQRDGRWELTVDGVGVFMAAPAQQEMVRYA